MKTLTIGDLHGRNVWKKFADIKFLLNAEKDAAGFKPFLPEYDYYVFVGDYTDAFDIDNETIYNNLLEIIKFKKLYPDNVILLYGNHDIQYTLPPHVNNEHLCTGHRPEMHFDLYELFNKNKDLFQLAFQIDNYLWTHAGVHKGWYKFFEKDYKEEIDLEYKNLSDMLNIAFVHNLNRIFNVGH